MVRISSFLNQDLVIQFNTNYDSWTKEEVHTLLRHFFLPKMYFQETQFSKFDLITIKNKKWLKFNYIFSKNSHCFKEND